MPEQSKYHKMVAKALINHAEPIMDAIGKYIAKEDEDLEKDLKAEGYAKPKDTVSEINSMEEEIADILHSQTDELVAVVEAADDLDMLQTKVSEMFENDDMADQVEDVANCMYEIQIPKMATVYMQESDGALVVDTLRRRTADWFASWSEQLGALMRINTHQQITDLIQKTIEDGDDIASLTRKIMSGGWRTEYYQAKRTAVTEVLRAHSIAHEEAIQQSPAVEMREWRHTGSHKNTPRPNHVAMDGQIVPKDQPFEMQGKDGNTYYPMFPRDPILPAGESVNCHCIHRGIVNQETLGLSIDKRKKMQQSFIDEDDGSWAAEENAKNKARAGIAVDATENEASPGIKLPPVTPGEETQDNEKFDYKKYLVDKKYIASAEYTNKYDELGENKTVTRRVRAQARKMLRHRTGTWYEDLAYVDTKSNKTMARTDFNAKRRVKPSRQMNKMIKDSEDYTIIGIHNHPGSQVPSYDDFKAAYQRRYKYGLVACHDGTIYKYTIIGDLNRPIAENALDLLSESGYSTDIGKMFNDAGIELEVF